MSDRPGRAEEVGSGLLLVEWAHGESGVAMQRRERPDEVDAVVKVQFSGRFNRSSDPVLLEAMFTPALAVELAGILLDATAAAVRDLAAYRDGL